MRYWKHGTYLTKSTRAWMLTVAAHLMVTLKRRGRGLSPSLASTCRGSSMLCLIKEYPRDMGHIPLPISGKHRDHGWPAWSDIAFETNMVSGQEKETGG